VKKSSGSFIGSFGETMFQPWELIKQTIDEWLADEAPRMGAALAYYAVFSLAPLLVIVVFIVGFLYKGDTVVQIQRQVQSLVGTDAAKTIAAAIHNVSTFDQGIIASIVNFVVLSLCATGVFSELHAAMNKIWKVRARKSGFIMGLLKDRFASFIMVVAIAFLLLVSMIVSAVLSAVTAYFSYLLPGTTFLWYGADLAVSFLAATLLFALLFRYVPDERVTWKDLWIGAVATALLFDIGKFLIGFYIGKSSVGSMFGAAGSGVVILAWVYYSSQLVFLGAEFTHVYAKHNNRLDVGRQGAARRRNQSAVLPIMMPPS
jgi:membrane protein